MIYLDNAATTYPKPYGVIKSVSESMVKYGANPGRSGYKMAEKTAEMIYQSREAACNFFKAKSPGNVIFTPNCTAALNMCLKALAERGGNIVCSSLEHNAVSRPLHALYEKGVCEYRIARIDINDNSNTVTNFDSLIDEKTNAVVTTAASNVFGFITPVKEISDLCKKRGVPLVVDAAQAAGIIPINLSETNIDYLCIAAHKGLYAPVGTDELSLGFF